MELLADRHCLPYPEDAAVRLEEAGEDGLQHVSSGDRSRIDSAHVNSADSACVNSACADSARTDSADSTGRHLWTVRLVDLLRRWLLEGID